MPGGPFISLLNASQRHNGSSTTVKEPSDASFHETDSELGEKARGSAPTPISTLVSAGKTPSEASESSAIRAAKHRRHVMMTRGGTAAGYVVMGGLVAMEAYLVNEMHGVKTSMGEISTGLNAVVAPISEALPPVVNNSAQTNTKLDQVISLLQTIAVNTGGNATSHVGARSLPQFASLNDLD